MFEARSAVSTINGGAPLCEVAEPRRLALSEPPALSNVTREARVVASQV